MWTVILKDRNTKEEIVVADMCNMQEVCEICLVLLKYDACDIIIVECDYISKKGKNE